MNIQEFIISLFPQATEEQTTEIASYFLQQGFNTVQQLKAFSQDEWRYFNKLPFRVLFRIKNEIKALSNCENCQKVEQNMNKSVSNENPQSNKIETIAQTFYRKQYYLNVKQMDRILFLLNKDTKQQEILQFMDAEQGSPKEEAILEYISLVRRPPKQYPNNAKRITPRLTNEETLPLFHYQQGKYLLKKYYTFLVVGETGSGKTTLLDAFVNKLNGMEYKDNWRWRLVDESFLNKKPAGASKTSQITVYYINDIQNKFNIRIIDTPGFGDTSGIKVDNEITEQFQRLFNEIDQIDYILLTIKASETRLRHGSKYIYDKVQQLFGKDAKDHFILMCTFADSNEPSCLQVVKQQIYYSKYFTFNNSALYIPPNKENDMAKLSWKMGMKSIQAFSQYVIQSDRTPLSLQMSQKVLQNRKYLEQSISASQNNLKKTLIQLDVAKKSFKNLQDNRKKIEQNGTYEEFYPKTVYLQEELPKFIQMCQVCKVSCCLKCEWPQNELKSSCNYFTWQSAWQNRCPICPLKCPRQNHVKTNKKITKTIVIQKRTVDFKKKNFEQGVRGEQIYFRQFDLKAKDIQRLVSNISDQNEDIKKRLKELEATALKPTVFTDQEYYRQMIKAEEETKENGWTQRVKYLQAMIQKLQTTKQIQENNTIYDLIPDLQEFESQIQQVERGKRRTTDRSCAIY